MAAEHGFTRSDEVRKGNRRRVLAAIRRLQEPARAEIAVATGLSPATVSAITSELIGEAVLVEAPGESPSRAAATGLRGRPRVALALNPGRGHIVTLIFQFNFLSASVINYRGETIGQDERDIATRECSTGELRAALEETIRGALAAAGLSAQGRGHSRLLRIAVACQGSTDVNGLKITWTPIATFRDIPVAAWLEETFRAPVRLYNDCDLIALSLHWRNPQRYGGDFAAILLAGGVGMGLYHKGKPINGTVSSGMEFGHMNHMPNGDLCRCGRLGCIEAYAGDYAIDRRASGLPGTARPTNQLNAPDIGAVVMRAREGDGDAVAAIRAAGTALGYGLANIFALTDPFPIALVGRGSLAFEIMEQPLREALSMAMTIGDAADIAIECHVDERPLMRDGGAISALDLVDLELADPGHGSPAGDANEPIERMTEIA